MDYVVFSVGKGRDCRCWWCVYIKLMCNELWISLFMLFGFVYWVNCGLVYKPCCFNLAKGRLGDVIYGKIIQPGHPSWPYDAMVTIWHKISFTTTTLLIVTVQEVNIFFNFLFISRDIRVGWLLQIIEDIRKSPVFLSYSRATLRKWTRCKKRQVRFLSPNHRMVNGLNQA